MGVPRLRHHLQPYADRVTLNGGSAVIDGPALAYYIHGLCSTSAVKVPSCEALGQVCLGWLDELTSHGLSIEAIYFDGHLPEEKLPVRKDRVFRRSLDLGILHRSNPTGCPASLVATNDADCSRRHKSLPRRQQHTPPPNPFLVQAIIDTLRLSPRYGPITHTVPAEADSFCAEAARTTRDAVILTGDSDLLVYDIGSSSVVFLDDIRLSDGDTPPSCFKFSPLALEARLNLLDAGPVQGLRRFAFELIERPYATLLQLSDACRGPVDESGYAEFTRDYDEQQSFGSLPLDGLGSSPLDSRLLELVIQLNAHALRLPSQLYPPSSDSGRVFLPNPIENYGRPSCFDPSSEIRRIAYSLLPPTANGQAQVWEFKRLHAPEGRGTAIPLCPLSELPEAAREIATALSNVASKTKGNSDHFWLAIALGLDARYSRSEGKEAVASSLVGMKRRVLDTSAVIPWDLVHFRAQVHACCYSFRLLAQVLSLARTYVSSALVDTISSLLRPYLSQVPPLAQLPAMGHILGFLSPAPCDSPMARILRGLEQKGLAPRTPSVTATPSKARGGKRGEMRAGKGVGSGNPFEMLDVED